MNKTILFSMFYILSIFLFACTPSQALTDIEKMKVFYKYDSMFFFGDKEQHLDIELGDPDLKDDIKLISNEYRKRVEEYINVVNNFIKENHKLVKEYKENDDSFHKKNNKPYNKDKAISEHLELKKKINDELLPKLKYSIRCMYAINTIQYIEIAKEIGDGNKAKTVFYTEIDNVYWSYILHGEYPYDKLKEKHTNAAGNMKYEYWFYESNLKIRIVKQVRDENGNYLGEIYTDYYKLDQYDKLFDEKGNPRKLKKK